MSAITERIKQIREQIPVDVRLIAITKQVDVVAIAEAYDAGIRDFGESRLQEALPKQEQLQSFKNISWHFVGHLQTRKAKKVLESFEWIHSVDTLKLAEHLNYLAGELSQSPSVCIQVKILPDPNKYGWHIQELIQDLPTLNQYKHLKIKGLMTILPLGLSDSETLKVFASTRELAQKINEQNWSNLKLSELSMGMSGDYLLAIQAGATMIRLGNKIFK